MFAKVRNTPALDPAYRPNHLPSTSLTSCAAAAKSTGLHGSLNRNLVRRIECTSAGQPGSEYWSPISSAPKIDTYQDAR